MDSDHLYGYLVRVTRDGEGEVKVPLLRSPWFIGRDANCQIRLKDPNVSERHCMLVISQRKKVTIHRLDSEYPVLVNGKEVVSGGCPLRNSDVIQISNFRFRWSEAENDKEPPRSTAHISFCSENPSELKIRENRRSAPAYLSNESDNEVTRDGCETSNLCQWNFCEDSKENEEAKSCENNGSEADSDEEIFSDSPDGVSAHAEQNIFKNGAQNSSKVVYSVSDVQPNEFSDEQALDTTQTVATETNFKNDITEVDVADDTNYAPNINGTTDKISDSTEAAVANLSHIDPSVLEEVFKSQETDDNAPNFSPKTNKYLEESDLSGCEMLPSSQLQKDGTPRTEHALSEESEVSKNDQDVKYDRDDIELSIPENAFSTPPKNDANVEDAPNSFSEHLSTPVRQSNDDSPVKSTPQSSAILLRHLPKNIPGVTDSPEKFRGRRSTGVLPSVGTPSDVYRIKRSLLTTPAIRSSRDTAPKDVEILSVNREPRRRSSERKLTPMKARISDRCIQRESVLHSPIIEDEASERCEESQNESLNADSKFKFVQSRRPRRFKSSNFAIENRILEESETSLNTTAETVDNVNMDEDNDEEDKSLIALNSCDDSAAPMAARILMERDHDESVSDIEEELNSTFTIDAIATETQKDHSAVREPQTLKSILTPLLKIPSSYREKSAKKVTFACNVIAETYSQSSVDCSAQLADSSYNSSLRQSSFDSVDTPEFSSGLYSKIAEGLDSFCQHEELFSSERSRSSVFSQNSSSTPVKSSNNASLSGRKLRSVTRSLSEWDKSSETSETRRDSRNYRSSAVSLAATSIEDDVDLTALQDAEKLQSGDDFSSNKTRDRSTNSTKEMSDQFTTPTNSMLVDSLSDTRGSEKSRSKYASTPVRSLSVISDGINDNRGSETLEGVADLLKTPHATGTISELDRSADTSQLRKVKRSTGVTPLLDQMKLNKTIDRKSTPGVKLNRTGDRSKCVSRNNTPNFSAISERDASLKVDKNVTGTAGTPYPNSDGSANSTLSKSERSFSFLCLDKSANTEESTPCLKSVGSVRSTRASTNSSGATSSTKSSRPNRSRSTPMNARSMSFSKKISLSTESTRRKKSDQLEETVGPAKDVPARKSSRLNRTTSDRESTPCTETSNLDETTNNSASRVEPLESVPEESTMPAASEILSNGENAASVKSLESVGSEFDCENIEEVETQDVFEVEILEEAETQDMLEIERAETQLMVEPPVLEEAETQDILEIERAETQLMVELSVLEEAETQDILEIEQAETQLIVEPPKMSESKIVAEKATTDTPKPESFEEMATQLTSGEELTRTAPGLFDFEDDSEEAESHYESAHFSLGIEEVETQDLRESLLRDGERAEKQNVGALLSRATEEAETQDLSTLHSRDVEEGETQDVITLFSQASEEDKTQDTSALHSRDAEEAETQDVIECPSPDNAVDEKQDVCAPSQAMEEAETQDIVALLSQVTEEDETQDVVALLSQVGEEDETQDVCALSQDMRGAEALGVITTEQNTIEGADTQDAVEEVSDENILDNAETRSLVGETTQQDLSEETESRGAVEETIEAVEERDVTGDDDTDQHLMAEPKTGTLIEEAETQDLFTESVEAVETRVISEEKVLPPVPAPETNLAPQITENDTKVGSVNTEESTSPETLKVDSPEVVTEGFDLAAESASSSEVEPRFSHVVETSTVSSAVSDVLEAPSADEIKSTSDKKEKSVENDDAVNSATTEENESVSRSKCNESNYSTPTPSYIEVVPPRTESPPVRRSTRISIAKGSQARAMRTSLYNTPTRFEVGLEKSASKRSWKDRDNQENEVCFNIFHRQCSFCTSDAFLPESARKRLRINEDTPSQNRSRTPGKKHEEIATVKTPGLQAQKLAKTMVDAETQTSARKNSIFPSGKERRALKKLDNNSKLSSSPYSISLPLRRSNSLGPASPFFDQQPVSITVNNVATFDGSADTRLLKTANENVSVKQKHPPKKRNDNVTKERAVTQSSRKVSSPKASDRPTRTQKESTASDPSEGLAKTSGRMAKRTINAVSSPTKASSETSTKRVKNAVPSPPKASSETSTKRVKNAVPSPPKVLCETLNKRANNAFPSPPKASSETSAKRVKNAVPSPPKASSETSAKRTKIVVSSPPKALSETSAVKKTNERGENMKKNVVSSPASTSSQVGSPRRTTRKRRNPDAELASSVSPPKRALRDRAANIAPAEEKSEVAVKAKSKRGVRANRETLNECFTEETGRRTTRTKTAVEPTVQKVEAAETKRAIRSKKKDVPSVKEIAPTGEGRATRGGSRQQTANEVEVAEKAPSKNKRGTTRTRQMSVEETQPEPEQPAARTKRAPAVHEQSKEVPSTRRGTTRSRRETKRVSSELPALDQPFSIADVEVEEKRATRTRARKAPEEEQIEPEPKTKPTLGRGRRKNAPAESPIVDPEEAESVKRRAARSRASSATNTKPAGPTKLSKKTESAGRSRGPTLKVTRKSLTLKTITRESMVNRASHADEEPREKRAKVVKPNEEATSSRSKKRRSVKVIVAKKVTSTTSTAKKPNKSCLKKVSAKDDVQVSPAFTKRTSMVTRGAKTRTNLRVSFSSTTRKKK